MIALHRVGCAIMTTIVAMAAMRANTVMPCTKHAHHKSSRVRTSNVFAHSIVVMAKTTVAIVRMRWAVQRRRTAHAPPDNLHVPMDNALTIIWCATKWPTVQMSRMNRCIATLTNALKSRSISAVTSVWTH